MTSLPTLTDAASLFRSGQLKPSQLLEFCLERIRQHDDTIHAWVQIDESRALEQARQLDQQAALNHFVGPLHGIPVGIKDIIDVKDLPTRAGSPLRNDHRAQQDAPVVSRLRQAGAIILGKTVTCQFAFFDPSPTRNPWNPTHTPGGSSAGSAAAIAAEMCPATVGSQTGGSIIRPASYCGVPGFKPTFNTLPTEGVFPVSQHLDHVGLFARSIPDLNALFSSLTPHNAHRNPPTKTQEWSLLSIEAFFNEASLPVQSATRTARDKLEPHLSNAPPFQLPDSYQHVHSMHRRIMAREAAAVHQTQYRSHPESYSPKIAGLIEEGLAVQDSSYQEALLHQKRFQKEFDQAFPPHTLLLTPATNTTAPATLETTGDPRFNSPWSYAGLPTLSIPCGLAQDGLPISLQIIAPRHTDHDLLAFASRLWPNPFPLPNQG